MRTKTSTKTTFYAIVFLCVFLFSGPMLTADYRELPERLKAAEASLSLLKKLPPPLLKELGFKQDWKLESLRLSGFLVTLDAKIKGTGGAGPAERQPVEAAYAVMAGAELFTSITIRKREGQWAFAVFGEREAMNSLKAMDMNLSLRGVDKIGARDCITLDITALNLRFLGYFLKDELYLFPLRDDPDLNLKRLQPLPLKDLLEELEWYTRDSIKQSGDGGLQKELGDYEKSMKKIIRELKGGNKERIRETLKQFNEIIDEIYYKLEAQ
jgi:hypothetical protein